MYISSFLYYSLVRWSVAQDNVEGIDAVNCLRVHVDVDILEEVLKASRVQLGNTLDHGLGRLPLPCALE